VNVHLVASPLPSQGELWQYPKRGHHPLAVRTAA
jgi:hypothetical protein